MPSIRQISEVQYFNRGDWVEHCTALLENHHGHIKLLRMREAAAARVAPQLASGPRIA